MRQEAKDVYGLVCSHKDDSSIIKVLILSCTKDHKPIKYRVVYKDGHAKDCTKTQLKDLHSCRAIYLSEKHRQGVEYIFSDRKQADLAISLIGLPVINRN